MPYVTSEFSEKIAVDRPAVEARLAVLEAGDFADGVVARFEGRRGRSKHGA